MSKERKLLLWAIIFAILFIPFDIFIISPLTLKLYDMMGISTTPGKYDFILNVIFNSIYILGTMYLIVLTFNKKIDINKHYKGIMFWSILYILFSNLVTGILGLITYDKLEKIKYKKRELPNIEYKEFTNKYICLVAFIICMIIMFVLSKYVTGFLGLILIYASIFILMISVFYKQLVHDFKIFKEYFREYMSLTIKTWLKSLVVMMILGIILQLVTNLGSSNNQESLQKLFNVYPIFVALLSMFYAPFAEELMFRGVFRKFIKSKYLFIIVSGVMFGLLHVIDDSKTLAEFSYIIVYSSLGIYLASLYYKTNNLFTNISFHFMQNTLGVIGMIVLYLLG